MIDRQGVFRNSLWIAGLALHLATNERSESSGPGGRAAEGQRASRAGEAPDGRRRLGCGLLAAGLVVILGWSVVTGVQLYSYGRSLQAHLRAVEAVADQGAGELDAEGLAAVGEHLAGMRHDLEAIEVRVGPLLPAGRLLGWLPAYGGDLAAADELLDVAVGVAAAGDGTFRALAPAFDLLAGEGGEGEALLSAGERLLPAVAAARPALEQAQKELVAVEEARASIEVGKLSPRVRGLVARLDRYLPWFGVAVDGALLLPELLGHEGPRTYLVISQNNQELRATGGFISGVGELRVEGGRLVPPSFRDSYAVDNLAVPHEVAPADFQAVMLGDLLFFRDGNWDPDFRVSAQRLLDIYARDQGVQADGVVALDIAALQLLVSAAGPLTVAGVEGPVTGGNVLRVIQEQWNRSEEVDQGEWWLHRKDLIGEVAAALTSRLGEGQGVKPVRLARAIKDALDHKHLLVYLPDERAAGLLRRQNWDGALPDLAGSGDVLAIVDSNAGFNKVDAVVERAVRVVIDLTAGQVPQAQVSITYRHGGRRPGGDCLQEARYGDTYGDMIERCYWDYLRVYVPGGSRLIEGPEPVLPPGSLLAQSGLVVPSPAVSPTLIAGEWAAWTAFFALPTMEERTLTWTYELQPGAVTQDADGLASYRLRVHKQPGTGAVPLQIELRLPPGAELVKGEQSIETDLAVDRDFELVWVAGRAEGKD